jgi:hypothetical protein
MKSSAAYCAETFYSMLSYWHGVNECKRLSATITNVIGWDTLESVPIQLDSERGPLKLAMARTRGVRKMPSRSPRTG